MWASADTVRRRATSYLRRGWTSSESPRSDDTAIHVFSQFESGKFGRANPFDDDANADINRCLGCDLLILDDLGAEMPSTFVTSALYQLVNSRLLTGKRTIINTNLAPTEIEKRYGAAVASRLMGEYQLLTFFGEDIRRLKRDQ